MFSHLTVSNLRGPLRLILATLAVVPMAMRDWYAWTELRTHSPIVRAIDASTYAFQVVNNLRSDRTSASRT